MDVSVSVVVSHVIVPSMWHRKAAECEMCHVYREIGVLFVLLLVGTTLGAARPFAKEYRSAGALSLMDMELDSATTLDMAGVEMSDSIANLQSDDMLPLKAESSVVVPGVQLNTGELRVES